MGFFHEFREEQQLEHHHHQPPIGLLSSMRNRQLPRYLSLLKVSGHRHGVETSKELSDCYLQIFFINESFYTCFQNSGFMQGRVYPWNVSGLIRDDYDFPSGNRRGIIIKSQPTSQPASSPFTSLHFTSHSSHTCLVPSFHFISFHPRYIVCI